MREESCPFTRDSFSGKPQQLSTRDRQMRRINYEQEPTTSLSWLLQPGIVLHQWSRDAAIQLHIHSNRSESFHHNTELCIRRVFDEGTKSFGTTGTARCSYPFVVGYCNAGISDNFRYRTNGSETICDRLRYAPFNEIGIFKSESRFTILIGYSQISSDYSTVGHAFRWPDIEAFEIHG